MQKLSLVKARRYVRLWWIATYKGWLAPIFNRAELFQLIQFPIFLFIVYLAIGEAQVGEELTIWWAGKMALIWAVPVWLLLNAFVAPFRVIKEEKEKGRWYGAKFVYDNSVPVRTLQIMPEDDGESFMFTVMDAEPNTFVKFHLEYFGGLGKAQIGGQIKPFIMNWDLVSRNTTYGQRIDKKRRASITVNIPDNSDLTIIRIQMLSWEA